MGYRGISQVYGHMIMLCCVVCVCVRGFTLYEHVCVCVEGGSVFRGLASSHPMRLVYLPI